MQKGIFEMPKRVLTAQEAQLLGEDVEVVADEDLIGLAAFWRLLLHATDEAVASAAANLLLAVYLRMFDVQTAASKAAASRAREDALASYTPYAVGDKVDVQDFFESSKIKGKWFAKWRAASVIGVGLGPLGCAIRVSFDD